MTTIITKSGVLLALAALGVCPAAALAQYFGDPGLDPRVAATLEPPAPVPASHCEVGPRPPFSLRAAPGLWPGGIVPFEIESSVTNTLLTTQAMDVWMFRSTSPNITFVHRDPSNPAHANYLKIRGVSGSVSGSYVGVCAGCGGSQSDPIGSAQIVSQAAEVSTYVMAHEFCHALGFDHEQCRPDRDSYVTVWYSRVSPASAQPNFDIRVASDWPAGALNTSYDFGSVMHYGANSFMAPGCDGGLGDCLSVATCTPLVARADQGYGVYQCTMGQRSSLSTNDVQDMINVYGARPRPLYFVGPGTGCSVSGFNLGTISYPICNITQVPGPGDVWIWGDSFRQSVPAGTRFTAPGSWRKHGPSPAYIYAP